MSGDPMARLRSVDPARRVDLSRVDPGALRALREGVTMTVREPETLEVSTARAQRGLGRLRLGRRGTIAVGLSVVLASGALGFAAYQQFRGGTDGVNCLQTWDEDEGSADGPSLTGDPIADCTTYRERVGLAPIADPVAFEYDGLVFVTPRDQVPEGVTPLVPDPEAAKVRELEASSHDLVDGGLASCHTTEQAQAAAQADLDRLGLDDWHITVDETPLTPEETRLCAWTDVNVEAKTVRVLPHRDEGHDAMAGMDPLVVPVREAITGGCLDLAQARAVVEAELAKEDARMAAEYPGQDLTVSGGENHWPTTSVVDESASCARVDLEVGGSIQVTVYGPTTAHPAG